MKDLEFRDAIWEAINRVGSELRLAKETKVPQSTINGIKNKKTPVNNITLGTLKKLFPDMQIDFFGTGEQKGYTKKILQLINRLEKIEQEEIYEAIIAHYPHTLDNDFLKTLKKR